jgi:hypothetical protein
MYTRVKKDQFEIRDGVYIHRPTEAEFAPNPNSEGSMLIYTGNIILSWPAVSYSPMTKFYR